MDKPDHAGSRLVPTAGAPTVDSARLTRRGLLVRTSALAAVGAVPYLGRSATAAAAVPGSLELFETLGAYARRGEASGPFRFRHGAAPVSTLFVLPAGRRIPVLAQEQPSLEGRPRGWFGLNDGAALGLVDGVVLPARSAAVALFPTAPAVIEFVAPAALRGAVVAIEVRFVGPESPGQGAHVEVTTSSGRHAARGVASPGRAWNYSQTMDLRAGQSLELALSKRKALERLTAVAVAFRVSHHTDSTKGDANHGERD